MSLVLQPQAYFTVVHQIPNHLDSATYYIKAVIRNAYTDDIIDTLELEDKGSQRFKKDWRVPADSSGQGFYISIVTSVYTDSGYTTKSENYGDDENTYLVQNRVMVGGFGGSGGIDTFDVRRVIKEELLAMYMKMKEDSEKETPEEEPQEAPRWDEIINEIKSLKDIIPEPEDDKTEETNQPLLLKFDEVLKAIQDKEVTEKTDLGPVLEEIRVIKDDVSSGLNKVLDITDEFTQNTPDSMKKIVTESIDSALKNAQFNLNMPFKIDATPRDQEKKEKPLRDISNLEI